MRSIMTIILAFVLLCPAIGQDIKKQEAKEYFLHQRYGDALAVLSSARNLVRTDREAKFLLAISHYQLNGLEEARTLFTELTEQEKEAYPECWLYLGKIYHAQHQFGKAAKYYKDYLRRIKSNHANRKMVWDAISRCAAGMRVQFQKAEIVVENMGPSVNTDGDEFAPILSPNHSDKLYFSSIRAGNTGGARNKNGLPDRRLGQHYSDMFSCELSGGLWSKVKAMPYLLNSPKHEVLLDFNADGSVLYYYKGWQQENGQIYVDTFRKMEERRLSSDPFSGPINPSWGDGQPYFVNDTLVYFSSRRPGGYGGLDIYKASYSNGSWEEPQNLGSNINTAYDECTPFLARDGRTLYFSSNQSQRSIGGLDVLKAVYNDQSERWTVPENVGIPINSAADDAYFRIAKDGYTAYFSSARKDGYGERDIYIGYFNSFLPEMEIPIVNYNPVNSPSKKQQTITQVSPNLADEPDEYETEEDRIVEAEALKPNIFRPIYFDEPNASLNLATRLQLNEVAGLMKEHEGLQLIITAFNTQSGTRGHSIFKAVEKAEEAAEYLAGQGVKSSSIFVRGAHAEADEAKKEGISLNFSFFKPEGFPESIVLPDLESGLASAVPNHVLNDNLIYKVQIFSLRGSSDASILENHPHAMVEKTDGVGYYRYTLGAYTNYEEAEAFRKKMVSLRQSSAFVVPYIYGLRANKMIARRNIINFPNLKNYAE